MKNDIETLLDTKLAHLRLEGLSAGYGPFLVLRDLTLEARPGLTVILGPNGAGKTTLLKAINGLIPRGGRMKLDGELLPRDTKTSELVQRGMALVPEGRKLFPQMTVRENLELGGWLIGKADREQRLEAVLRDFPKLAERIGQQAGTMSGGEQQMVAVARAMMSAPRLLMLDEPSLGLAPQLVNDLFGAFARLRDEGTTILLVDQMAGLALALADRGYVIESGHTVHEGTPEEIRNNPALEQAYLGATG